MWSMCCPRCAQMLQKEWPWQEWHCSLCNWPYQNFTEEYDREDLSLIDGIRGME